MAVTTSAGRVLDGFNKRSRAFFSTLVGPWSTQCNMWMKDHYADYRPRPAWFMWLVRNQANILSTARLPIGIWVAIYMIKPDYPSHDAELYWALLVMVAVFLSDGFDGALARDIGWRDPKTGQWHDSTSKYGKAVDPVADKATAGAMVYTLSVVAAASASADLMKVWYIVLIPVGLFEACLIGIALWTNQVCVRSGTNEPAGANTWGKFKFFFQAVSLLLGLAIPSATTGIGVAIALLAIALPLACLSLLGHKRDLDAIRFKIQAVQTAPVQVGR